MSAGASVSLRNIRLFNTRWMTMQNLKPAAKLASNERANVNATAIVNRGIGIGIGIGKGFQGAFSKQG